MIIRLNVLIETSLVAGFPFAVQKAVRRDLRKSEKQKMARPERFELPTLCFEGRCSIQLSYGRADCTDSKSFTASNKVTRFHFGTLL
jgi:hypothetical protein